ncbi:MAG TPA: hypothetical protein VF618_00065 [Thermoanaerobaculia bacterium]
MNDSNRRRVLAGTCTAALGVTLLFNVLWRAAAADGPQSHTTIALAGFLAVLHVGLIAGMLVAVTQLVRRKADRLGLFGAALTLLGATVSARIFVLIQLAMLSEAAPGAPRASFMELLASAPLVFVSLIPIGLTYPLGLITLGIALFVARPVSRWLAVGVALGGVLFPIGRAINVIPALYASDAVLGVTFAVLGWQLLTRRALWEGTPVEVGGAWPDAVLQQ